MDKITKLLEIARNQLGVKELTGSNDGEPSIRYAGSRKEPWCAHFCAWIYRNAGITIPGDVIPSIKTANPLASVSYLERVFKDHDWFFVDPEPGDIIFFLNRGGSDSGPGRHCGIVETVTLKQVSTIEGNLGNKVGRMTYSRDNKRIAGYGRIPKDG